jgi:hypothetical protein
MEAAVPRVREPCYVHVRCPQAHSLADSGLTSALAEQAGGVPLTCQATLRHARLLGRVEPPSHPTNAAARPAVQLAAGRPRGGEKLGGDVAAATNRASAPQRRVGWQPSRFLADRGEAERALRWPKGWVVSTLPRRSWTPRGRRCAKPSPATGSACPPATPKPSGRAPSTPPASAPGGRPPRRWTRCCRPQPQCAPGAAAVAGGASPVGPPRRGIRHPGRQRGRRAVQRKPRASAHHPRVGDHPPGRAQPPSGRPTRQPFRAPPRRPPWPVPASPGAGDGG